MRGVAAVAGIVAAIAVIAPAAASAAVLTPRLHDAGPAPGGSVATDGRYIVRPSTTRTDAVDVLDTRTDARRTVSGPRRCHFHAVHEGILLWNCDATGDGATFDLADGTLRRLPAVGIGPGDPYGFRRFEAAGRAWVRIDTSGALSYLNRATGEIVDGPLDRQTAADLDDPSLTQPLCAPLVPPLVTEPVKGAGVVVAADLVRQGDIAVETTTADNGSERTRVVLERCGQASVTLRTCPSNACNTQPVLVGGDVAWLERDDPAETANATLWTRAVDGTTLRHYRLGHCHQIVGVIGGRLYLAVGDRLTWMRLSGGRRSR